MTDDIYISAKKLKAHYAWWAGEGDEMSKQKKDFDDIVDAQPAADVEEVRHSHWEQVSVTDYPCEGVDEISIASMFCPNCKRWSTKVYVYGDPTEHANYCSFCGAKMDGKEKEE